MSIPPLPRINRCPNCGEYPEPKRVIWDRKAGFSAMCLICECGVAGPLVKAGEWQHQRAYAAWGKVFGRPSPVAPVSDGKARVA